MLLVKTPKLLKLLFAKLVWNMPTKEKVVYLTFDDGPTAEITEWALAQLKVFNAKATFFCIGKNIEAEPEIFKKIIDNGHTIGNHTYNHLNGWKNKTDYYIENTLKTEDTILKYYPEFTNKKLFRPPYGKFTPAIVRILKAKKYNIIAWDIITEDYNAKLPPEKVFNNVTKHVTPGSIIVFHDSVKAHKNLKAVLPKTLNYLHEQGYTFKKL